MKSFQEIYHQVLAEMQEGRLKRSPYQKSSAADQPPYILKTSLKPISGKKPKALSSVLKKEKPHQSVHPRVLTETQKEALECFQRHGEMLDDYAGMVEIKRAFRRLAKRLHPDKVAGLSPEIQKRKAHEFHQIHLAYRHLLETYPPHK